jgi:hypothetical protein
MYNYDLTDILTWILALTLIITFFVMAYRLRRIMIAVTDLRDLELKKPGNTEKRQCWNCDKAYSISILEIDKTTICPHCNAGNKP